MSKFKVIAFTRQLHSLKVSIWLQVLTTSIWMQVSGGKFWLLICEYVSKATLTVTDRYIHRKKFPI